MKCRKGSAGYEGPEMKCDEWRMAGNEKAGNEKAANEKAGNEKAGNEKAAMKSVKNIDGKESHVNCSQT